MALKVEKKVPKLRFPHFKVEWESKKLEQLSNSIRSGKSGKHNSGKFDLYGSTGIIGKTDQPIHSGEYILVARVGANAGQINVAKGEFGVTDNTLIIELKDLVVLDFLKNFLIKFNLNRLIFGSGQPLVTGSLLKKIKVTLPSLPEQQKIASFLTTIDTRIRQLSRKVELLEQYKKGVMQQIFSQEIRFKNEEGKDFPEWEERKLGEVCEIKGRIGYRGYTKADLVKKGQGALTIGAKHINNNFLDFNNAEYISWEKYEESPEIKVEPGHILFVQRGSLGQCALVNSLPGPATINPSMVLLKQVSCNADYLYNYLASPKIQKRVKQIATSTAVPMLSQRQIASFNIELPCRLEQEKIAKFLSAIDQKINLLKEQLDQTQTFKKGLLQQLFV